MSVCLQSSQLISRTAAFVINFLHRLNRQWRHFSQTLGGGLTFHTQLLLRVRYCNARQTIMQNIHIIGKNIANCYASIIYQYD